MSPGPESAAETLLEGVPAAVSLAPSGPGISLGGELVINPGQGKGVESIRSGLLEAGPLAAAGVLANGANVIVTVGLARLLTQHSYGVLIQLTGLFLIFSLPGSAVVVAVVRRVTLWQTEEASDQVRRWAGRIHRQGAIAALVWILAVFACRHWVAVLLGQKSGIGISAILAAAAVFILLSLDRGLLQAHRSYRPLAVNLIVEGGVRTVAVLALVAGGFGASGAAVGILIAEVVTALHARWAAMRAWTVVPSYGVGANQGAEGEGSADGDSWNVRRWAAGWVIAVRKGPEMGGSLVERHRVVTDLVVASISLSMIALLQNADVLVVGRDNPSQSGAYAAVSVTSKAIVFGAIVMGGYLLPEAAIRWRQGGHALRQLATVLVFLAVPAVLLLGIALAAPALFLRVVFHHSYAAAAPAMVPLVLAMILLSISVVLTMYLLAIGRRWVAIILTAGALGLVVAVSLVHGHLRNTAVVDLAVQAVVMIVIVIGFTVIHRVRHREHAARLT